MIEYIVATCCGRLLCWSAVDLDQLRRDLHQRGYIAKSIKELGK